jgi:type IX secretion system PorP/SprF family membrane protein
LNRRLRLCLWLVISFFSFKASAQDNTDFVQFFVNSAALNPSYTGIDGQTSLYLGFRRQWVGVPDGPKLGHVSMQGLIAKKLTGGFSVSSHNRGLLSTNAFLFTGGYHIMVAEDKMIRFGLSVGSAWNRVDASGIVNANPDDPAITLAVKNNFFVQGNAGVSYHSKTLHAGIALPQLFTPKYSASEAFAVTAVSPFQSVVLHASNRFYFNRNKNVFEPYVIYRLNQHTPSQFEVASIVHLQNQVWFGASFRQGLGVSAMAGIKLNKTATLGYAFTTGFSQENQIVRPSHEIQIALLLGKRHKNAVGIYSFVNTEKEKKKKTPAQLAAERKAKQEALAKKYQQTNVHTEPHKPVVKAPEPKKEEVVVQQQQEKVDTVATAPVVTEPVVAEPAKPERHEFVTRARNKDDMDATTYIIVGAFRSEANARKFSNELLDMEYTEANYGFITSRSLWYVTLGSSHDINEARAIRDKVRHEHNFKDAWILTVE